MFKNIFQRMFVTYLAVNILSVTTLAFLLNTFISDYHLQQKQQDLLMLGREINELFNQPAFHQQPEQIRQAVDHLGKITGTKIYIFNLSPKVAKNAFNFEAINNEAGLVKDIPKIMSGSTVMKKKEFSGYLKTYVVYVGMPLSINQEIVGAVLLFSPLNEIKKIVQPINKIVWLSAAAFMLLATLLIHLVSYRISVPIVKISQAAEEIAAGKFDRPIDINGADEVSRLAKSFLFMRQQIQQTERMRQELLANVSHELRTPLTTIRGFIQAILDGIVEPQHQQKYLQLSYQEAGRLAKLTDDLLDLAKLQTGHLQLCKSEVNLGCLLEQIAESFSLNCSKKNILLKLDITPKLTISVDPDRFPQVVINLLHNALKFTPAGGSITLSAKYQDNKIVIQVADTGIGIASEELNNIFEHFYKSDKSRNASQGGAGIGLYVAKQIVELHGGTIAVMSEINKGSTFTIVL
ncbi:sensor histidine kinase [Desulforamulus hydrothermalis]|uniref:histidine kinase n=1 Tax=Desulforamulus hydrothermalis Lam5 = DSM 18033 TaxID=1121428 RepID=K8DXT1_9FIRM|nr:HAMP domain-containing sensor histidine kinase [Desulforamulus hydrothermalis]CCO07395.1 putative HAMP domain protein [Desulforamulus hydrothermalis Lam5 = DSM 18033]SHH41242.1 Signal transduction histidine kinase [Desulforamulus hydrothermalis Lam5 = DSM 18033]